MTRGGFIGNGVAMRYLWIWVCLALLFPPDLARAQSANPSDSTDLVRALLARVEQLEKRVAELEGRPLSSAPAAQPPVAAPEPAVRAPQVHMGHGGVTQMSVPSTHIAGFSDIDFSATDKRGSHSGFNEGQFVLHLNSALSSKVSFFGELSLTARSDAGTGTPPATGFNIGV